MAKSRRSRRFKRFIGWVNVFYEHSLISIQILHTVGSLGVSAGGPSRTIPALCKSIALTSPEINIQILTTAGGPFGSNMLVGEMPVHVVKYGASFGHQKKALCDCVAEQAAVHRHEPILHDHGQWLPLNRASAVVARQFGLKRIVTPRGMLTPWALRHHRWKKKLAWLAFARRDFHQASVLHATSQMEAEEFRRLGARQPIAMIPNGVEYRDLCGGNKCKRSVLFLSRIHVVKGVSELVNAWRALKPDGWNLILAGPDEGNLLPELKIVPSDNISYVGQVDGDQKWQLLEGASVFVLPSYSENFGVVVAESLMASTPVIATHGTPWKSLVDRGCGWWIPMSQDSLQKALRIATSLDESALMTMGERGRAHAIESFGWQSIGKQMADVYRWMLGLGDKPDCVQKF